MMEAQLRDGRREDKEDKKEKKSDEWWALHVNGSSHF
jgi:hypothetical protein